MLLVERFDQLDDVSVGILDEGRSGICDGLIRRLLSDAVVVDIREGGIDVVDLHREVVPEIAVFGGVSPVVSDS